MSLPNLRDLKETDTVFFRCGGSARLMKNAEIVKTPDGEMVCLTFEHGAKNLYYSDGKDRFDDVPSPFDIVSAAY